jgi:PAS domain S-box-containing protein
MIFWEDLVFVIIVVGLQFLSTTALKGALNHAHQEIIERRRTEADLQQAKAYAENLLQAANAIIIGVDQNGQITIFNQAAEKLTGYSREELANRVWLDVSVPKERYPKIWEELNRTLASGYPRNLENPIITKNGEERIIVWQNTKIGSETISFGIDVTDRKLLEQERLHDQAQLEVQRLLANQREQERIKIARDLHDGPVQQLVGITFSMKALIEDAEGSSLQPELLSVQSTVQELIDNLRIFAGELRPPTLMKFGLEKAIRSHLDEFHEMHPGIAVQLDALQLDINLPEAIRLALFRIYQEAMSNILRHAHATQVSVRLHDEGTSVILEIQDNGVGFVAPTEWMELARNKHLGLVGMRERVDAIGGQIAITSQNGIGTSIHVSVPVNRSEPGNNQ